MTGKKADLLRIRTGQDLEDSQSPQKNDALRSPESDERGMVKGMTRGIRTMSERITKSDLEDILRKIDRLYRADGSDLEC